MKKTLGTSSATASACSSGVGVTEKRNLAALFSSVTSPTDVDATANDNLTPPFQLQLHPQV